MIAAGTIFFDVNLPNGATWFYFSGLLAIALFFKFSRLLSMRNLDVLTLFLLMPGFLLLADDSRNQFWGYLWLLGASGYFLVRCLYDLVLVQRPALTPNLTLGGLVWLGCALFVGLVAVAVRPPEDNPVRRKLHQAGALLMQHNPLSLAACASCYYTPPERAATAGVEPAPLDVVRRGSEDLLRQRTGEVDDATLRLWVERGTALVCHLVIVVGLALIGWRHFEDLHAGIAAAAFYLLLPYTYLLMPATSLGVGRWDHAWPMALMIWTILAYRRPALSGMFLGLATGTVFFPILLLPVWVSFYWRRGAARFLASYLLSAGLCLAVIGTILWLNGELPRSLQTGWTSSAWQSWKQPPQNMQGLWRDIPAHWAYRLPVFLVYLVLLSVSSFWPSPKNLAHVIALSAALLIGIQFWFAEQGGVYVLWYLPFLLLLVFRPNLSTCQPPPPPADDWVARLGRWARRWSSRLFIRLLGLPEPAQTA
jgi:hypothetical protein